MEISSILDRVQKMGLRELDDFTIKVSMSDIEMSDRSRINSEIEARKKLLNRETAMLEDGEYKESEFC